MKHVHELTERLREERNPGADIGAFLLAHTNTPEYLAAHLESYLAAVREDIAAARAFADGLRALMRGRC